MVNSDSSAHEIETISFQALNWDFKAFQSWILLILMHYINFLIRVLSSEAKQLA